MRRQPVLGAGHEINRASDVLGNAGKRHAQRDLARLLEIGAAAAHAKGLDVDNRPTVKIARALVGARQRDAGLDALFKARGARREITAQRHAPDTDARQVNIHALFQAVDHRLDRLFIFRAERKIVLTLALPGAVKGKRRQAALEEAVFVIVHLLLGRIQAHAHHHHRWLRNTRRFAQVAVKEFTLVRDGHALARRIDQRQRAVAALHRLHVCGLHLRKVVDEQKFAKVIAHRGAGEMRTGRQFVALRQCLDAKRLVLRGARRPGAAPILPALTA